MKKLLIFIDDMRFPKADIYEDFDDIFIYRNYKDSIKALNFLKDKDYEIYMSLDHDLGEDKTGYDIAKYIVENNINIGGFNIHSMNVVGRKNIRDLLTHYGYKEIELQSYYEITYLDDNNTIHLGKVKDVSELNFMKDRFQVTKSNFVINS